MYVKQTLKGQKARNFALDPRPMGLGLSAEDAARIDQIMHICSSFTDEGEDWNRFDCYDANGKQIFEIKERGY